jgi:hypothetical protein
VKSDVRVCTYHYDNQRLGWNPHEEVLTPASVSSPAFGKLWHNPLDGLVHGAPLLLDGQVFVVTDANSAFALDAKTGKIVWERRNLLPTLTAGQFNGSWNSPERHGVLSTPVIDPVAGVLYFCAPRAVRLKQVYEVHALDVRTGASVPGWPVALSARYKKTPFVAGQVMQRGALTLSGGRLYIPFGGRGDIPPWRGWVIGLDVQNPRTPQKAFCFSPITDGAGVWSAGGVSIDEKGRVYAVTGNGDYDLPEGGENFGQSIVRLSPDLAFSGKPADFFTPDNYRFLDEQDEDLGGATCLILPTKDPLLFTGGKDGCAENGAGCASAPGCSATRKRPTTRESARLPLTLRPMARRRCSSCRATTPARTRTSGWWR